MIHKAFSLTATKSAAEGLVLARFGTSAGVGTSTIEAKCDACAVKDSSDGLQSEIAAEFARAELILARIEFDRIEAIEGFACRPRVPETEKLAGFAIEVAHGLAGRPEHTRPPALRWFEPDGRRAAFMRPGQHTVWLALDARNVDLCESVLHECCHIAQVTRKTIRAAGAEAEAVAFASRWGRAVMAAHSLSGGDSSRVVVRKTRRPWYDVPAGSVVLHRGGCYGHNPFNSGPSWTRRSAA